jgi:hypothetical protein
MGVKRAPTFRGRTREREGLDGLLEEVRRSRRDVACDAVDRLSERLSASGTEWAKGTEARSRALVEENERAEDLHRQAIECLEQRDSLSAHSRAAGHGREGAQAPRRHAR